MRDNVINDAGREMNQAPVQHDVAVAGAGAPARGRRRQPPAADLQAADLQKMRQPRAEPGAGALLQPGLRRVADTALIGRGRQRQQQGVAVLRGVGIAGQAGLAAVATHAKHDALAQVRQFATGLPARVRDGQLLLAGMPFAQLGEDPAGFLAHRLVNLRQRDPTGRRHPQAVIGNDKAYAASARAQQHETDGLLLGGHLTPARAGRQRIRTGRGHARRRVGRQRQQWLALGRVGRGGIGKQVGGGDGLRAVRLGGGRGPRGRRLRRGDQRRRAVERDQWRRALGRVVVLYVEQEFELISARHTFRD
ncbi:hypothetical protein D3C85_657930 [compost metagenome]